MTLRHDLDGFVLDAVGFDADQLDAILTWLNEPDSDWRDRFERRVERTEVLGALLRLVRGGMVSVWVPSREMDDYVECGEGVWPASWPVGELHFDLTGRGRVRFLNRDS